MRPCKGILAKIGGVLYLFSTGGATFTLTHFPFIQFSTTLCGHSPMRRLLFPRAVYIVPSSPCHGFLFTEECALLCSVFIIADGLLFVNTFLEFFWLFPLPSWEYEVATLGRYLVRLAVLGYLTTAFCSLGSLLSRPVFCFDSWWWGCLPPQSVFKRQL